MKRYNEFINDGFFDRFKNIKKTQDILTREDVEDQFLRLKEVFNLDISIIYVFEYDCYYVSINQFETKKIKNPSDEYSELIRIKNRIKSMYKLHTKINYGDPERNSNVNIIHGVWISFKK